MTFSSHTGSITRDRDAVSRDEGLAFRLPATEVSVAQARRQVRSQLTAWGVAGEPSENAQLVISELVTNALRHTDSESVACELRLIGTLLRVAVASGGAGPRRGPLTAADEDEGGRGLLLVCTLAHGWGVRPQESGNGHVVWADLPL